MHTITKQCRGEAIPVVAIPTHDDCCDPGIVVGRAASYTAALRRCRDAGCRVLHRGGIAEVTTCYGAEPSIGITVWPMR